MMKNVKPIPILFLAVLTSFFYFPFEFSFLPGINTKMAMAGCGLVLFIARMSLFGKGELGRDMFVLTLLAVSVSFASLASMIYNNTSDAAYLSYIISMWVWLGGAYFVVSLMRKIHGTVSVEMVCLYLVLVGTLQCLLAISMDLYSPLKAFVDSFLGSTGFMGKVEGRLYGVGCALDVAGGRFAVLLIMIAFMLPKVIERENWKPLTLFLIFAFLVISSIGNMIGRTTTVGMVVGVGLIFTYVISDYKRGSKILRWVSLPVIIFVLLVIFLYNTNPNFEENLRFGFEGFFSLAEKGEWDVHSNNLLSAGFVFPDNLKTWIIGDGYMGDPLHNPYYTGAATYGFYMNTDVGYSRFVFYFGLVGLGLFCLFMMKCCIICTERFDNYRMLFIFLLLLNYLLWIKTTTDIFLAFALFLCVSPDDEQKYENTINALNVIV